MIQQNNLISVKTRSKKEQRSRSTLQWYQRQQSLTSCFSGEARTTLSLHAWGQGRTDRNSLDAEWSRKMTSNATWTGNVLGWHSRFQLHSIHSMHSYSRTQELSKIITRVRAKLHNCRACVCKSKFEVRIAGDCSRPQISLVIFSRRDMWRPETAGSVTF